MALANVIQPAVDRARLLPARWRYAAALVLSVGGSGARVVAEDVLDVNYPFITSIVGVVLCAALFGRGPGLVATAVCAASAMYFDLEPLHSFAVNTLTQAVGLLLFLLTGSFVTTVIDALHDAILQLRERERALMASERAHALLLREFRHRSRNDLGSLVALLRLRARAAVSQEAKDALNEASAHALALARVHTRLASAAPGDGNAAVIGSDEFVLGLVDDIGRSTLGDGLRPVALDAEAERHLLSTERCVVLGLVINETITNALKYAFPDERTGTIKVRFRRDGEAFVLGVQDDGIGLPAGPAPGGMGTRLLRGLAAQLRGTFTRHMLDAGGVCCELRFPAAAPVIPPLPVV